MQYVTNIVVVQVVKQCLRNGHMINEFDYNECCRF